jgi:hypothetical protein
MIQWLCRQNDSFRGWKPRNEHEWDALLSAWATYQGITGRWTTDLMPEAVKALFPTGPEGKFDRPEVLSHYCPKKLAVLGTTEWPARP